MYILRSTVPGGRATMSTYSLQADVRNHNNHVQVPELETEVTAHGDRPQYISAHMHTQCQAQTSELSMFRM